MPFSAGRASRGVCCGTFLTIAAFRAVVLLHIQSIVTSLAVDLETPKWRTRSSSYRLFERKPIIQTVAERLQPTSLALPSTLSGGRASKFCQFCLRHILMEEALDLDAPGERVARRHRGARRPLKGARRPAISAAASVGRGASPTRARMRDRQMRRADL